MRRIVITRPDFFRGEADTIADMLDRGACRVHIRKPGAAVECMAALIEAIPEEYRGRISLHDCPSLACRYGIGGIHLNSRCPSVPDGFRGMVSRSCHSIAELRALSADISYAFLSPVFDSISKTGYRAAFGREELSAAAREGLLGERVFALGGVAPANFTEVEALGFGGAALLGAAWQPVDRSRFRLQYITQGSSADRCIAGACAALAGGCRWVQLRMKEASADEIVAVGRRLAALCHRAGATFLLDDHVELVATTGADGVHVGRNDMPVAEARRTLGPGYIVGATANTFDDIATAAAARADYIGLGPFRFTTTKKNLSPVLGLAGYGRIMAECRRAGIDLPVVAIGGIETTDVEPLCGTGVHGVAVSGAIAGATDPVAATADFINNLKKLNHFNLKICKN